MYTTVENIKKQYRMRFEGADGKPHDADVEVTVDMIQVVYGLGGIACRSKGKRCQDGPVKVKCIGVAN